MSNQDHQCVRGSKDPYGRNTWGVPPQNAADYAFIQHIAQSLDPNSGRAAILLPHGVLTRVSEASVRRAMVESDLVEAVIGLAPGLFYNSSMEAIVLVLRARKPRNRRGRVLFINAVNEFAREQAQSFLREQHQQKILAAYDNFADDEGFAAVVTHEQIVEKTWSLAIPLYVKSPSSGRAAAGVNDIENAVESWRDSSARADTAVESALNQLRLRVTQ
ncbi:N-6 DNA methylase [Saccharomonospora saliphila]|uniref:N-6 DNA methylase n=1 Tax=Saccharomonospora saliphila TaxID=369829 RepID=UPI0022B5A213|nr:N-6 DNA methylase [Saccharomonospora saliphila]